LSPASHDRDQAENWMRELGAMGLDGIIAKRLDEPYRSGERTAMVKIKRIRTADCVVGGFRYAEKGGGIGSLLLGLYNEQGQLDHVGFTSSFNAAQRRELKKIVKPLIGPPGFTGRAPGGPSRWSTRRSAEWQPLKPTVVCGVPGAPPPPPPPPPPPQPSTTANNALIATVRKMLTRFFTGIPGSNNIPAKRNPKVATH